MIACPLSPPIVLGRYGYRRIALPKDHIKVVAENRKAGFDYFIEEKIEAGIVLTGTEVKSLRAGRANLKDSYAKIKNGEVWLVQLHISPYAFAYYDNHDPLRERKLLLHKQEIKRLIGKIREKGYSLIPVKLYFRDGKVKVSLGLAKGKRQYDKREAIKKRDEQRDQARSHHDRY